MRGKRKRLFFLSLSVVTPYQPHDYLFLPPPFFPASRTICVLHIAFKRAGSGSVAAAAALAGPGSTSSRPRAVQTEWRRKGTVHVRTAKNEKAKRYVRVLKERLSFP